jgi:Tfp pilus assembly protein PilF
MRGLLSIVLTLAVGLAPATLVAQVAAVSDVEVKKGVQQVDDGEYDAAILTLDAAVRRLAASPGQAPALAQAYLYLGIAYLAKGQETSARVRFREAVKQARDLNLSPDKFAPKVIGEFERAREEVRESPGSAAKKSGGTKYLLIGGGVAAAGVAAVVLASGGEPYDPNQYEFRDGTLTPTLPFQSLPMGPGGAGHWKAELSWKDPSALVGLTVYDSTLRIITNGRLLTSTTGVAEWEGEAGTVYQIKVGLQANSPTTSFELNVTFPKP